MKKTLSIITLTLFLAFKSAEDKPRIFLIGDSTCANKNPYDEPETGWGQVFPQLFTDAIEIQNHAVNGRSTRSFRTLGHWKKVSDQIHKGDYVFIQFGHNDQKESDTARYAPAQTDYRKNLIRYIEETQAKGATPVLLTPVEMSGGVRNMFISDCTFMGSDVGLRFKTARGRGGVVEKIYVNNINMTEIPGEAILFDMYYAAKDPVSASGENAELPIIKAEPLNEGTPQFKDFYIKNIVCKGAETGILIRGLPEMSIKNINIENALIECNKGLLCVEAENINLKNITLLTQDKTIGQIQNSENVTLDNIKFGNNTDTFLKVQGTHSKAIRLINTDISTLKNGVVLGEKVGVGVVVSK